MAKEVSASPCTFATSSVIVGVCGDQTVVQECVAFRERHFRPVPEGVPARLFGKERRHGNLLKAVTVDLVNTYSRCSQDFRYSLEAAPRRVLTKMTQDVHGGGCDNAEHDYICRVGDRIENEAEGRTYEILDWLGQGTFGQVLKCNIAGSAPVALKIIKNKPAYFNQARVEVRILQRLNTQFDPNDEHRIIRMFDSFVYRKHLCVVFELLSMNLYDVLRQNNFRGVSMVSIRTLTKQILEAMRCLRDASVIHCDLKPENVMVSSLNPLRIKLIDFGSACAEYHTLHSYIQSRFYRSPEVLLGLPYTSAIDMWSLGCICAELFLGLPIFPGHSEYDQVCRIVEVLDLPPPHMLNTGTKTKKYFRRVEESADSGSSGDRTSCPSADGPANASPVDPDGGDGDGGGAAGTGDDSREVAASTEPSPLVSSPVPQPAATPAAASAPADDEAEAAASAAQEKQPETPVTATGSRSSSAFKGPPVAQSDSSCGPVEDAPEVPPDPPGSEAAGEAAFAEPATLAEKLLPGVVSACLGRLRPRRRYQRTVWRLKTLEEFEREERKTAPAPKKYFNFRSLEDLVKVIPAKQNLPPAAQKEEQERRLCYLQFLTGVLQLNPEMRWTPKQALQHSFVNPEVLYDATFVPPRDDTAPVSRAPLSPLPPGAWSGSVCASVSSASSAASTPSALSVNCGGRRAGRGRGGWIAGSSPATGRKSMSSTTVTPASSPHGSVPCTAMCTGPGGPGQSCHGRNASPWHLPSPMSEQSTGTASERMPSSHYSGSDSCGELMSRGSISQQSDASSYWPRSAHMSDSDGASGGAAEDNRAASAKEPRYRHWKNVRTVEELSKHLPPRMDPAQSSGSPAGNVGNFREAVGLSKSGPVVPFGLVVPYGSGAHRGAAGGASGCGTGEDFGDSGRGYAFGPPARVASSGSAWSTDGRSRVPALAGETGGGGAGRPHRARGRRKTTGCAVADGSVGASSRQACDPLLAQSSRRGARVD